MLYLRTGSNGSCKTLFTLADVRKLQLETGRPVCWNGRFKLKPEKAAEFGWKLIEFKDWEAQEDGTIFLIDECHNDLPNRPNGSTVPQPVKMLAEHRSRGFDFFLLTQHPGNIDNFVRKLIGAPGYHQHLKRMFGATNATRVLQWDAVHMDCEKDGSGKSAEITTRVQPKEVYSWYDSAMLHTGKKRIPKQVWVLLGSLLLMAVCVAVAVHYLGRTGKAKTADGTQPAASQALPGFTAGPGPARKETVVTPMEYVAAYTPRIGSLMHTAPIYDELTKPKRVPVPAACMTSKSKGCKCYTQDGTPYQTDPAMCKQIVEHGVFLAFNAEGEERQAQPSQPAHVDARASAPVQSSGLTIFDSTPAKPVAAPVAQAEQPVQRVGVARRS
jgi:zona occludens toxin